MHHLVLHHRGAQDDAAVERSVGREIADAARIGSARIALQLGDDLAGAQLGRAADRPGGEAREESVDRVEFRIEPPDDIAYDMHDMTVTFDCKTVSDFDAAARRDPAHIVAPEVEQHQVLGPFLRVGQQRFFGSPIGLLARAARARAGDGANGDFAGAALAGADPDEDFRARPHDCEIGQVEEIEEGGRVHPAQRAVEFDRGQGEGAGIALGQDDLEDVACDDVVFRAFDHSRVVRCGHHRIELRDGQRPGRGGAVGRSAAPKPLQSRVDAAASLFDQC